MLPASLVDPLSEHLLVVQAAHEKALREGCAGVELPYALVRKCSRGSRVVLIVRLPGCEDHRGIRHQASAAAHHLHESTMQKAFCQALRAAKVPKHAGCHTLRRSFATHLLEGGYDMRTIQSFWDTRTYGPP